jgi:hypothetical protein
MCCKNNCKETITIELEPRQLLEAYAQLKDGYNTNVDLLDALEDALIDALQCDCIDDDSECCECPDCCDDEPTLYLSDIKNVFPVLVLNDEGKATSKLYVEQENESELVFYTAKKGKFIEEFYADYVSLEGNTFSLHDCTHEVTKSFDVSNKTYDRMQEIFNEGVFYKIAVK